MPQASRSKDEERRNQFNSQRRRRRCLVEPLGKMMRVPGQRRRNRLGFVVERQRRQRPPRFVAAGELHQTRAGHEPEHQPQHQPHAEPRRIGKLPHALTQRRWRDEDREESCLEQQGVPLIRQEVAADDGQRQIVEP